MLDLAPALGKRQELMVEIQREKDKAELKAVGQNIDLDEEEDEGE